MSIWFSLLLFVSSAALDAVWADYTASVTAKKALRAANLSGLIYLLGVIGIVSYVHNRWYIVPVALGGWAGTFFTVKRTK